MNRISKLIHKSWFHKRQRQAINQGRKYTISDKDVENWKSKKRPQSALSYEMILSDLLEGFDPENNTADRRILFEITGQRFYQDEFNDDQSSGDEDDDL